VDSWRATCNGELTPTLPLLVACTLHAAVDPVLDAAAQLTVLAVRRLPRLSAVLLLWQLRLIAAAALRRSA